jgi:cold shock CspA family protein
MHEVIDDKANKNDVFVNNIFVQNESKRPAAQNKTAESVFKTSEVLSVKNGYGFIKYPPNNLFFHATSLDETDINQLQAGDLVEFTVEQNEDGEDIATNVKFAE